MVGLFRFDLVLLVFILGLMTKYICPVLREITTNALYGINAAQSDPLLSVSDDEPSLQLIWWYNVRLLQWHHAEGFLPSLVVDWVLTELQVCSSLENMFEVWQLLLPIIYGFLETVVLSQNYMCTIAEIARRVICDPTPVPYTFVGLDCFPLPSYVVSHTMSDGNFVLKSIEDAGKIKTSRDDFGYVFSSIHKDAEYLARATSPGYPVFFLCEWATCDFRDFRTNPPCGIKFTGGKDLSQVHIVVRLLEMKMREMKISPRLTNGRNQRVSHLAKCSNQQQHNHNHLGNTSGLKSSSKYVAWSIFVSPGPLHDIVVCWIDQHVMHKGEGYKRLHLFIVELVCAGIFYPIAYVRQLIVSGIMDMDVNVVDLGRKKRHYHILKQLPRYFMHEALDDSGIVEGPQLDKAVKIYLNERRLILRGVLSEYQDDANISSKKRRQCPTSTNNRAYTVLTAQWKNILTNTISCKSEKDDVNFEELKADIALILQLPNSLSNLCTAGCDDSEGSIRRPVWSYQSKIDPMEGAPGCEECRRVKRQKISEERCSFVQGHFAVVPDNDDAWWVKKGLKFSEPLKIEQHPKSIKQVTKTRQKNVRKTQSLAQLQASRIEGSQRASSIHMWISKHVIVRILFPLGKH
ncbi:unnamed protein product [Lupinus luteus]|uniref:Uncharacterized protein n=1 Tax=Lupinus luteus TaxID=3873 RepID=A0AAV1X9V2_LUPLU